MTIRWPPLPRRLPRVLAPLRHETYDSYLARLAAANHISFDALDEVAHLDDEDPATADQLAALTGYPASALVLAIPELFHHKAIDTTTLTNACPTPRQFINDIRPPCRRCAAVGGADPDIAQVWATHDVSICPQHRLWIGDGNDQPARQLDLRPCPDIIQAQIRHHRIVRSRGRAEARAAFHAAWGVWASMSTDPGYSAQRDARSTRISPQASAPTAEEAVGSAATYPETVAFTAILASPCWRAIILSRRPADNHRFHHEFSRRVAAGHHQNGYPRLLFWLRKDLEHERDIDDTGPYPAIPRGQPPPPQHAARLAGRSIKRDAS